MKKQIKRKGNTVRITLYMNRRIVYNREAKKIFANVNLTPYDRLRVQNDMEVYLTNAENTLGKYIEKSCELHKNVFYASPAKHFLKLKNKTLRQIYRHIRNMI